MTVGELLKNDTNDAIITIYLDVKGDNPTKAIDKLRLKILDLLVEEQNKLVKLGYDFSASLMADYNTEILEVENERKKDDNGRLVNKGS